MDLISEPLYFSRQLQLSRSAEAALINTHGDYGDCGDCGDCGGIPQHARVFGTNR